MKDFAAITLLAVAPTVLCTHVAVPARSVQELLARAKPGELTFASGGSGTAPHMAGEIFAAFVAKCKPTLRRLEFELNRWRSQTIRA